MNTEVRYMLLVTDSSPVDVMREIVSVNFLHYVIEDLKKSLFDNLSFSNCFKG